MSVTNVNSLNRSMEITQIWLKDLKEKGRFDDEGQAYSVLRSVLQTLRDRLPVGEATDLAAQLPIPVRGVFYEGWKPSSTPTDERTVDDFLTSVRKHQGDEANVDLLHATRSVFQLLDEKVTAGEMDDVKQSLPQDLSPLWN